MNQTTKTHSSLIPPSILLVEDDEDLASIIMDQLKKNDYQVTRVKDGHQAMASIDRDPYHLFLFDWMIPGPQGPDLCQYLRKKYPTSSPPIMMMTAKASPEFIVEGLDSGADDYITKPFTMEVLLARVRGLLRRSYHTTHTIKLPSLPNLSAVSEETLLKSSSSSLYLKYGPLHLDESRHEISLLQKILNLTMSEFKILKSFMERPGHVYTRKQLIEKMSGQGIHVGGRTIDTQIVGLRKKLGDHGHLVETIRGVGYRLREIDDEP